MLRCAGWRRLLQYTVDAVNAHGRYDFASLSRAHDPCVHPLMSEAVFVLVDRSSKHRLANTNKRKGDAAVVVVVKEDGKMSE